MNQDEVKFPLMIVEEEYDYIQKHKVEDKANYTIFVIFEKDDEPSAQGFSFDINVWDEDNNERVDGLEVSHMTTYGDALIQLKNIVENHKEINFIRISDKDNIH